MAIQCEFHWQTPLADSITSAAEARIRADLQGSASPLRACHDGAARIQLSSPDPEQGKAIGLVHCSCGAPLGVVSGSLDGSSMHYTPAERPVGT